MGSIVNLLINLQRLLLNIYRRLFGRAPDYVVFEVSGGLPEFEPRVGFLRRRLNPGPPALSLEEVRRRLLRLSRDGRVRGVVLRVQNLDAGWATLEELRREISAFRERGGRVVAYLIEPDTRSYYLACAADEILATPLAMVGVTGLRTRINFVKDALQRVGVEAEVFAVSPYKSAYDTFARQDFSDEAREQAERLVNRRYETLVDAVTEGRGITPEEVREKIDCAPYSAAGALEAGLLDGVCYEDELPEQGSANDGGEREARRVGGGPQNFEDSLPGTFPPAGGSGELVGGHSAGEEQEVAGPAALDRGRAGRERVGGRRAEGGGEKPAGCVGALSRRFERRRLAGI